VELKRGEINKKIFGKITRLQISKINKPDENSYQSSTLTPVGQYIRLHKLPLRNMSGGNSWPL
jgi:hypothetical protein